MSDASIEQQATNYVTMRHIERVRNLLNVVVVELLERGKQHDQTKTESPEVEVLTANTAALAGITFGSPEYAAQLQKADMKPYLEHHYANNSHHPEHWPNGVNDMTLLDILEMLIDWKAASERHHNGNILKSIEINAGKYDLSPQLKRILTNTLRELDGD